MKKLILIFAFLLSNCAWLNHQVSPVFPSSNNFFNRFPANKKGIVILKINSDYPTTFWCKDDDNCLKIRSSKTYQIFMLDDGIYQLQSYEKTTKIYQKAKMTKFLAFEVSEGKINFIKNIDFKHHNNGNYLEFSGLKKSFLNQDFKTLKPYFKNYEAELKILLKKLNGDEKIIAKYLKNSSPKTKKISKTHKRKKGKK